MLLSHPILHLERAAALYPERTAALDGTSSISFAELRAQSRALAAFLSSGGVRSGDRVSFLLPRGPGCLTAALGILGAGAAYVPMDAKIPSERLTGILEDAAPSALICDRSTLHTARTCARRLARPPRIVQLPPADAGTTGTVPAEAFDPSAALPPPPDLSLSPCDVAYVLYTSGSTGTPKGVMVTHGNLDNYTEWGVSFFGITGEDRVLGTAPFHFDMSVFDIFCSLRAGATLCIAGEVLTLFPGKLARFVEAERPTLWKGISSLLMYMCRTGVVKPGRMPSLQRVIFAGEPLHPRWLAQWMEAFPGRSFYNAYGPTEATGISLCHRVESIPSSGESIPIGRPCKGAQAFLVGEDGRSVGDGEVGELVLAGPGIALGYLNDPVKTSRCFVADPRHPSSVERVYLTGDLARLLPDGSFVFVSRKDHQVKFMGYRIELGEIESALLSAPGVREAAVLLAPSPEEGIDELVAFYAADEGADGAYLLEHLRGILPPYMLPRLFLRLPVLPRNDRGKLAREVLRKSSLSAAEGARALGR
jgi:amino acid adenylation domain-containing protein